MKFPSLDDTYGTPVLEHVQLMTEEGLLRSFTGAFALNEDFFGAVLGGDPALGHHVVFYAPEQQWYFLDWRFGCYVPTTEEKLLIVLSQHLIRCAEAMPNVIVDVGSLFLLLRDETYLKSIIRRARSINAADRSFFEAPNGHKRRCGDRILDPALEPAHKLFIREAIIAEPERILTVNDCYQKFSVYCSNRGFTPVERRQFPSLAAEGIREQFGLGYRKDLILDGRYYKGWKGLATRPSEPAGVDVSKN
ncbi:MAG: hypothetical protein WC740_01290 [Verrucomicrobiia bacterium]